MNIKDRKQGTYSSSRNDKEQLSVSDNLDSSSLISPPRLEDDEITLKELIMMFMKWVKYLFSMWVVILIVSFIGGVIGLANTYFKKPLYTAELTFVLESGKQGASMNGYAGLASRLGIGIGGGSDGTGVFEGQNFFALMVSRSMIQKVLLTTVEVEGKKETLAEFYIDISRLRKEWVKNNSKLKNIHFLPTANPANFSLDENSLMSSFHATLIKDNLFVGNDKKSGLMSIKLTSENEIFSKLFVEVLAAEVSKFYVETKIKKSLNNLLILKEQADSIRGEFNAAIAGVASSIDANPNANPSRRSLSVPSQRRQVDAEANQAMLIELMKNLAVSQISLREETPLIQVIDRPVLPLPVETFSKLKGLLSGGFIGGLIAILLISLKGIFDKVMA